MFCDMFYVYGFNLMPLFCVLTQIFDRGVRVRTGLTGLSITLFWGRHSAPFPMPKSNGNVLHKSHVKFPNFSQNAAYFEPVILFGILGSYLFLHIWENILLKLGK